MQRTNTLTAIAIIAMTLGMATVPLAQATHGITGATGQTAAEKEVRAAEEQMHNAYVTGDVPLFGRLYADGATFTYNSGRTVLKQARLDDFATQAKAKAFRDLRDEIVSITVMGDVALARCTSRYSSLDTGKEVQLNILRVWHRVGGRWQVAAFQSTAVQPG